MAAEIFTLHSTDSASSKDGMKQGNTVMQSCMSTFKSIFGTGILAFPYAVKCAGLGYAIIGTIIIALWSFYTSYLIALCAERAPKNARSYDAVCEASLGKVGKWIGGVNLLTHQLPVATAYLIFIAKNIASVCGDSCTAGGKAYAWWFILALVPFFLVFCYLKNVTLLNPLSALGNVAVISSLIIILSITAEKVHMDDVNLWGSDIASFFQFAAFAFAGHTEVVPIYLAMADRKKYIRVIGSVSILAAVLFISFGGLVYLALRDDVNEIIFLSLNGAANDAAKIGMCFVIYFTLPLKMMPAFEVVENLWEEFVASRDSNNKADHNIELHSPSNAKVALCVESQEIGTHDMESGDEKNVKETSKIFSTKIFSTSVYSLVIRTTLCAIPVIIAMITDNFAGLVVVTAVSLGLVGFTLPPLMYLTLGCCRSTLSLIFHISLTIIGLAVTVYCTYESFKKHFFTVE